MCFYIHRKALKAVSGKVIKYKNWTIIHNSGYIKPKTVFSKHACLIFYIIENEYPQLKNHFDTIFEI